MDREQYVHRSLLVAATRDQDVLTGRISELRRLVDDMIGRAARSPGRERLHSIRDDIRPCEAGDGGSYSGTSASID